MMKNRLEELWNSADDGASSPVGPVATKTELEFDELLDAWYIERRNSIEFEILLDESRALFRQLLAGPEMSASGRKQALRLIRAIDRTRRTTSADEG